MGCSLLALHRATFASLLGLTVSWKVCDVREHGAVGDGLTSDTEAVRSALALCDEVVLPAAHTFLSGPLNLTSNQRLNVQGTLLASVEPADYPLVLPMTGYGWGDDENCFPPDADKNKIILGSLRFSPVVGSYNASNVSVVGAGTIDGRGEIWWQNCTACHYTPTNNSAFCGAENGHLYIKCIILPRQARDKHRENSKNGRFLQRSARSPAARSCSSFSLCMA